MKKIIQTIKGFFIIAIVSLFLAGCCTSSDSYYWIEYITYQSKLGTIYSENDLDEYDITVFRANVPYPIFKKKNNKHCDCFGNVSDKEELPISVNRELIIPINYKIESFDD